MCSASAVAQQVTSAAAAVFCPFWSLQNQRETKKKPEAKVGETWRGKMEPSRSAMRVQVFREAQSSHSRGWSTPGALLDPSPHDFRPGAAEQDPDGSRRKNEELQPWTPAQTPPNTSQLWKQLPRVCGGPSKSCLLSSTWPRDLLLSLPVAIQTSSDRTNFPGNHSKSSSLEKLSLPANPV